MKKLHFTMNKLYFAWGVKPHKKNWGEKKMKKNLHAKFQLPRLPGIGSFMVGNNT
jgi:hypothetical protein